MADKKPNISELARRNGIKPNVVHNRIASGWTLEQALNTPVRMRKGKKRKQPAHDSSPADIQQQFQSVCAELEAAERELILGSRRCKLIAFTAAILIALMASVVMYV